MRLPEARRVAIAATQPRMKERNGRTAGFGMAHAYNEIGSKPFDGSVLAGMRQPRDPNFYGSGESASVEI
jgi:hypothetical protein